MGKAARIKRERREQQLVEPASTRRSSLPLFWIVVGVLAVAAIATFLITAPSEAERAQADAAAKVPTYADVTVRGKSLPTWSERSAKDDAAVGQVVPAIGGTRFDGFRTTLDPTDGVARVYVVVAHWCPHCQKEVPRIAKWARAHELPAGVEVVAISTAVDEHQVNFPPAAWLAKERWPWDVLIDDEVGSAQDALGVEGFPFLVFTDQQGRVVRRFSGEMPIGEFDRDVRSLATPTKHPKG
jgi:thiol-disulfide isomerase/thioredoxin